MNVDLCPSVYTLCPEDFAVNFASETIAFKHGGKINWFCCSMTKICCSVSANVGAEGGI